MTHHTATNRRFRGLGALTVLCGALASAPSLHAQLDSPVVIDSIEATTDVVVRVARDLQQTTDVAAGAWSASSRKAVRNASGSAGNDVVYGSDLIEGTLRASLSTRGTAVRARSATRVEFSIDRTDHSRPDASWGWGLASPLESLMGGTPPACRARLECHAARGALSGSVRSGRIGLTLTRNGVVIADGLLDLADPETDRRIRVELDLRPGDYVLEVHCGFRGPSLSGPSRVPTTASGSVEYSLAFEEYGPGTAKAELVESGQEFELAAGSMHAPWHWAPMNDGDWRYRQVSDRDDLAACGGVMGHGSGGCQGFQFTRVARAASSAHDPAVAVNTTELLLELPRRSELAVSTLFSIDQESPVGAFNGTLTGLVVTRDATGEEVLRIQADVGDVDPLTGFGRIEDRVTLDADFYRVTVQTRTWTEVVPEDTGCEVGLWFAVVAMTP